MHCRALPAAECGADQASVLKDDPAAKADEDPETMETGTNTGVTDDAKSGCSTRYASGFCNACRAVTNCWDLSEARLAL